jgi:hypothetical protein
LETDLQPCPMAGDNGRGGSLDVPVRRRRLDLACGQDASAPVGPPQPTPEPAGIAGRLSAGSGDPASPSDRASRAQSPRVAPPDPPPPVVGSGAAGQAQQLLDRLFRAVGVGEARGHGALLILIRSIRSERHLSVGTPDVTPRTGRRAAGPNRVEGVASCRRNAPNRASTSPTPTHTSDPAPGWCLPLDFSSSPPEPDGSPRGR